jgi:hypothetical protein
MEMNDSNDEFLLAMALASEEVFVTRIGVTIG